MCGKGFQLQSSAGSCAVVKVDVTSAVRCVEVDWGDVYVFFKAVCAGGLGGQAETCWCELVLTVGLSFLFPHSFA